MTNNATRRRILIVDDQQPIHDTFQRVFAIKDAHQDVALADFESRFLGNDAAPVSASVESEGMPQFDLDHAHSGLEAIAKVKEAVASGNPYSLAFVDMRMPPGMDGMETTEKLWAIDSRLHVVICTAFSDHAWEDVLTQLGYSDRLLLLKKPFESDEARQLALALSEKARLAGIQERKFDELGREVERRRDAEEAMRVMAHRDALTGLPNRPYLLDRIKQITSVENHQEPRSAVLFLDLDNFKIINDSLGHDAGDDLLKQVADRLKSCVRAEDITSWSNTDGRETMRLGGDEFVVLLEATTEPQAAVSIARRIVHEISKPFQLGDRFVTVGTSVGVAYIDQRVNDAHEALRNADTAMYQAKHSGKGQVAIFDQTMHDAVVARMDLEDELRQTIDRGSFRLNYQPIVDLTQGTIQGVEVLLRWTRLDGSAVSPAVFIPVLEEMGLISRVGEWVLENSMRDFARLLSEIPQCTSPDMYLAVNVSQRQLSDPFFHEQLESVLERTGFDRNSLRLEMNESNDARSVEQSLNTMQQLHASGVGIQIDNFGKGQSSLNCFQNYPVETVKIDRSFTASIAKEHSHSAITQAIVQLAHNLSARIVAEGVESAEQFHVLRQWGCDAAQGYLFCPPLTCDELGKFLCDPMQSEGMRLFASPAAPIATSPSLPLPTPTTSL